jgi:glutamate/aspartate transport system substrate-binding protein
MPILPVLNKIKEQGVIHVGFQRHTPPFSYSYEETFDPIGYSVDICHAVITAIGRQFDVDELKICPVEITSSNRLAFLEQGLIDIECGSTTNTLQRQRLSLFSHSIFFTAHRILLKNSSSFVHSVSPQSLSITGIENSTSHLALTEQTQSDLLFDFVGCPSIFSAFERFQTDSHVDAIVADEVILKSLMLRSKTTDVSFLPGTLGGETYGFMIRKDDHSFKAEVDKQLTKLLGSNAFALLYSKWFVDELPGLGFNLALQMSPSTLDLVESPNDRAQ